MISALSSSTAVPASPGANSTARAQTAGAPLKAGGHHGHVHAPKPAPQTATSESTDPATGAPDESVGSVIDLLA
jgi:hypothetical protein